MKVEEDMNRMEVSVRARVPPVLPSNLGREIEQTDVGAVQISNTVAEYVEENRPRAGPHMEVLETGTRSIQGPTQMNRDPWMVRQVADLWW